MSWLDSPFFMSQRHKQSWLDRQVKEWWGFGFPGVTWKLGPSVYKGEREHQLDWFVLYWSIEITNHKHLLRNPPKLLTVNFIFLTTPRTPLSCVLSTSFLSDHLCRPIFAEPFFSDRLCQVICPFGPCLLPSPDAICQRSLLPLSGLCCYADDPAPGGHQRQKIDGQVEKNPDMDQTQAMRQWHPTHHKFF